jgi:hypothetical protein
MPQDVQDNPPETLEDARTHAAADHLSHLHKMSTTAGVTNQDYVAVNPLAVVAALLGLASGLAFFENLLLILPVLGVVFSIVAIRQINDSNGTQTGRGLAWGGLALSLLFGGGVVAKEVTGAMSVRDDERQINAVIVAMGEAVKSGRYADAYKLTDDEFQSKVKADEFQKTWEGVEQGLGKLQFMEWNGVRPAFEKREGAMLAAAKARAKFAQTSEERFDVLLRKSGSDWKIVGLPAIFAEKRKAPAGADVFNLD